MPQRVRRAGSITILSGLGGTLFAALIIWLFGQTVKIQPVLDGQNKLTKLVEESSKINLEQHMVLIKSVNDIRLDIARMQEKEEFLNNRLVNCEKRNRNDK